MNLIDKLRFHALHKPNDGALITSDSTLDYQSLLRQVESLKIKLASKLINQNPVIVCCSRTPHQVEIILALLWLEIPYIPITQQTPKGRLNEIIQDSHAQLICTDSGMIPLMSGYESKRSKTPKNIAYIIYTSGSTGKPKGVCISHQALNVFLFRMSEYFLNQANACFLATTTISFDIAALELFLPIWQGKTLFLANEMEHRDPDKIQKILNQYAIDLLQGTPSFWKMMLYSDWSGQKQLTALCGGEALTEDLTQALLPRVKHLWNMYGPTEATIWCSLKRILSPHDITIGQPLKGTTFSIRDTQQRKLAPGQKGELCISGPQLAECYLGHRDLTKGKFISNSITHKKYYRTGDVALENSNGEFLIFGRTDNQIKLRGHRIEMEEIEAQIEKDKDIHTCAVRIWQEQIVAYVSCKPCIQFQENTLKNRLEKQLPSYMIPQHFVYLDDLPLGSSGKIDRNALPDPVLTSSQSFTKPQNAIQNRLQQICCQVLNLEHCDIKDNFFSLGGHSLLAVRLLSEMKQSFNKEIELSDIYQSGTIEALAKIIQSAPKRLHNKVTQEKNKPPSKVVPLTEFQFLMWCSNLFDPSVKKLNLVGRRRIQGQLSKTALQYALNYVTQKHQMFSFAVSNILPYHKKKRFKPKHWQVHDFSHLSLDEAEKRIQDGLSQLYQHQYWSTRKMPLEAHCYYLSNHCTELHLAMPHLISDQQSMDILFSELSNAYLACIAHEYQSIPNQTKDFSQYALMERDKILNNLHEDTFFWNDYLKHTEFVTFNPNIIVENMDELLYSNYFSIALEDIKTYKQICVEHNVSFTSLVSAALVKTLGTFDLSCYLPEHIFLNTVQSSREQACFDDVVGCFLRTKPIKLSTQSATSVLDLSKQAQEEFVKTHPHQHAPSVIKMASIGHINPNQHARRSFRLLHSLLSQFQNRSYLFKPSMLNAYQNLSFADFQQKGFILNVNIWNNFFTESKQPILFEKATLPSGQQEQLTSTKSMLDICFMQDMNTGKHYLVISGNLKPQFKQKMGERLIRLLKQQCVEDQSKIGCVGHSS